MRNGKISLDTPITVEVYGPGDYQFPADPIAEDVFE
jgi:hypothetical protein